MFEVQIFHVQHVAHGVDADEHRIDRRSAAEFHPAPAGEVRVVHRGPGVRPQPVQMPHRVAGGLEACGVSHAVEARGAGGPGLSRTRQNPMSASTLRAADSGSAEDVRFAYGVRTEVT
jgi:hypothetical protein